MAMDFPSGPTVGQIVPLGGNQYIWDGTAWNIIPQQAPAALSDLPPSNPAVGQFWWRGTNGQLYVYVNDGNSSQWVQAAGQGITPNTWEKIADVTLSAVNGYAVLDLAAFKRLRIAACLIPSVAAQVGWRVSADNGATWQTGASQYQHVGVFATTSAVSASAVNASMALPMHGSGDAGVSICFETKIEDFNNTNITKALQNVTNTSTGLQTAVRNLGITGATAWNALQIITSTGTLTGSFLIEGVRG